jgi:hypothetical protein
MDENVLRAIMGDVDPARDLTDETLDELAPHHQLMAKITAGLGSEVPEHRTARTPIWRRVPALVGAGVAAVTLVIAGAVALFGSAPVVIQGTAVGSSKSLQTTTHRPVTTGTGVTLTGTGLLVAAGVQHNRWINMVKLDAGVLTISPAPTSMKTPPNAPAIARQIWATSQLQGYAKQAPSFGFGLVTITKHVAGVPVITKVPAWVGLAYENAPYHCPAQTSGQSRQSLLKQAPSSGLAAVVVGQPSGSPAVIYIAKSVRCDHLYPALLADANEQFSLPWRIVSRVGTSTLVIKVSPPACGLIVGDAMAATWRSGSLSSVTISEYGTAPEYFAESQACPATISVRKVIDLRGPMSASTHFVHPKTGPMTVVNQSYK